LKNAPQQPGRNFLPRRSLGVGWAPNKTRHAALDALTRGMRDAAEAARTVLFAAIVDPIYILGKNLTPGNFSKSESWVQIAHP
jgi:hypothetical protein